MRFIRLMMVVTIAIASLCLAIELPAQNEGSPQTKPNAKEKIPSAALLTERGRALFEQLRMLKRSRGSMGAKHPTLPTINKQIADIEEQLQAWEPAYSGPAANPFHPEAGKPQLNEYDLRQIVIRLNARVESLERRVAELEGKKKD